MLTKNGSNDKKTAAEKEKKQNVERHIGLLVTFLLRASEYKPATNIMNQFIVANTNNVIVEDLV